MGLLESKRRANTPFKLLDCNHKPLPHFSSFTQSIKRMATTFEKDLGELFEDKGCYLSILPPTVKNLLKSYLSEHPLGLYYHDTHLAKLLYFRKDSTLWSSTKYFAWRLQPELKDFALYLEVVLDAPFYLCQIYQLKEIEEVELWFSNTLVKKKPFLVLGYFDHISWLLRHNYRIVVDWGLKYEQNSVFGHWNNVSNPSVLADFLVVDLPQWMLDSYKREKKFKAHKLQYTYCSKLEPSDVMYVPIIKGGVFVRKFPEWIVKIYSDRFSNSVYS